MKTIRVKKDEPFILQIEDANGLIIFNQKLHSPTIKLQRGEPMRVVHECESQPLLTKYSTCPGCGSPFAYRTGIEITSDLKRESYRCINQNCLMDFHKHLIP